MRANGNIDNIDRKRLDRLRKEINLTQSVCHTYQISGARRQELPCSKVLFLIKGNLGQK
jgi:hypothetical protein